MLFGCLVRWGNQQTERRFVCLAYFFFVVFLGLPVGLTHFAIVKWNFAVYISEMRRHEWEDSCTFSSDSEVEKLKHSTFCSTSTHFSCNSHRGQLIYIVDVKREEELEIPGDFFRSYGIPFIQFHVWKKMEKIWLCIKLTAPHRNVMLLMLGNFPKY